jgi:tRNA (cmo5U34)-methyltransferase
VQHSPSPRFPVASTRTRLRPERCRLEAELRTMLVALAADFVVPGSTMHFIGIGITDDVLSDFRAKLDRSVRFIATTAHEDSLHAVPDTSVVILIETARTVHPLLRASLIANVYRSLRPGGCVLLVEAIRSRNSLLNNLFAAHAHAHGRVELPEAMQSAGSIEEELLLLTHAGFRSAEVFYRWYGSCGFMATK